MTPSPRRLLLALALPGLLAARPAHEERLRAAVRAARDQPQPWIDLGTYYWKQGQYLDAGRVLAKACERRASSAPLHFATGRALLKARRYRPAAVFLRRTLALDEDHPQARETLTRMAARDLIPGDWVAPAPSYPPPTTPPTPAPEPAPPAAPDDPLGGLVVRPDPEQASLAWEAARQAEALGDPVEAIAAFRRAYAAGRDRLDVLFAMAPDLLRDEHPRQARFALAEYLAAEPHDALAHLTLAKAHQLLGDREAQVAALEKALELDQDYTEAHFHLALAYDEVGNLPLALRHAQLTIRLDAGYKDRFKDRIKDTQLAAAIAEEVRKVFRKERHGGLTDEDIDEISDRLAQILGEENLGGSDVLGPGDRRQRVRDIVQDIREDRGREVFERIPGGKRRQFLEVVKRRAGDVSPEFEQALKDNLRRFAGS